MAQNQQQQGNRQVATIQPSRIPLPPAVAKEYNITAPQWRVLVDQLYPSAKEPESILMALAYCKQRNLDIFKKPVHVVPVWSTAKGRMVESVWPGIAEIRTTASRTGQYAGISDVEYGPLMERTFTGRVREGQGWADETVKLQFPQWAKVIVYRLVGGEPRAFHAKIFWEETYATMGKSDLPNTMWRKRTHGQLDKCVEAAALRKAFPEELGNVYAAEEMEGRTIEGDFERHDAPKSEEVPAPPEEENERVDESTGEIIDAEAEEIIEEEQASEPEQEVNHDHGAPEPLEDPDTFLDELSDRLSEAKNTEQVAEIWSDMEVEALLKEDHATQWGIAQGIKFQREKELR